MEKLTFTLTSEEKEEINRYNNIMSIIRTSTETLIKKDENLKKVSNCSKTEGTNKGQWGYYINTYVGNASYLLDKFNISSVADLGCGLGDFISILCEIKGYRSKRIGFEIEESLVSLARQMNRTWIKKKDLFDLEAKDISQYKGLFLWEPIADSAKAKELGLHIASIIDKNHYIFYWSAGSRMFDQAVEDNMLEKVGSFAVYMIYKKK